MKLLIITQKLDRNDDVLGFFTRWVDEFAKKADHVDVICLEEGTYNAPTNVNVFSLGKESSQSKLQYVRHFYRYIWQLRNDYDTVFVHMNPIYIVLAGLLWKIQQKKITLWYSHRQVNLKLRIAAFFADIIFTAAPESFRLESKKVHIVGQGIDLAQFTSHEYKTHTPFTMMTVGRITPIKNCATLIHAAAELKQTETIPFVIEFIGKPATAEDVTYDSDIKRLVEELGVGDVIRFVGSIPNKDLHERYAKADLTINMTPPGGIDKVVLESMASGVPVIVSNTAFNDYFGMYRDSLVFLEKNAQDLAEKIRVFLRLPDEEKKRVSDFMITMVKERSSVEALIPKLVTIMNEL